tara:strand:- start:765 stop:1622 length:858 start_codon:yes stop_codon:yes gene_type:complete
VKNTLPYLINLPPFIYRGKDIEKFNLFQKFIFLIYGKFISLIVSWTNKSLFCFLINTFVKDSNLSYSDNKYVTEFNNQKVYFPNKRILRFINGAAISVEKTFKAYCLDQIDFKDDDIFIDCGANVGEVNIALKFNNINVKYIGFEPDTETYECLRLNNEEGDFYRMALSNTNEEKDFFLDSAGGNSSLVNFGTEDSIKVESKTLDSLKFSNIKVLKIDAEGFEPEVLEGSIESLKITEFVSVDFGHERGVEQESTIIEVNNLLYEHGFGLYKFSDVRLVGLYKRK